MSVILMLIASACFATMAAMVKAIGHSLPVSEMVFFRSVLPLPFFVAFLYLSNKKLIVNAKTTLLFRSLFGFLAVSGFYYALTQIPIAVSVFLGKTQPLILALLAPWLVGEKSGIGVWIAIGTGLLGVALILDPSLGWSMAVWVNIGAATASALAHLMVRKLNRTDEPATIVMNFYIVIAVLSSLWMGSSFVLPDRTQWLLLTGIAFFSSAGQYLMTLAYRMDSAPVVAAASYASIIFSVFYGYIFWEEIPPQPAWIGGLLIIAGSVILMRSRT